MLHRLEPIYNLVYRDPVAAHVSSTEIGYDEPMFVQQYHNKTCDIESLTPKLSMDD